MRFNSIIVRYGEISLKGRNRIRFELALKSDLENFLKLQEMPHAGVVLKPGRIYIRGIHSWPALEKVLGVYSYSPALEIEKDMSVLKQEVRAVLPFIRNAASFRVSCQRIDKTFSANSMDIERAIGEILLKETGVPVNLDHPDAHCFIEVAEDNLYIFLEKIKGFGGFPYGISGKLVSLMSSGIDSPVAAFLMMKRGVEPVLVHFRISESDGDKMKRLKQKLEEYSAGRRIKLQVIDRNDLFGGRFFELYQNRKFQSYMCVLCKYLMHRKAGEIARQEQALGIITGDNLAQVASQTLKNLHAYQTASGLPVFSPLIGFEKQETIQLARKIGTYDISISKSEGCIPPPSPRTGVSEAGFKKILRESGLE